MGASLTFRRVGLHVMLVTYSYVCMVGSFVSNDTFLHLTCVVVCMVDTFGDAALLPVSSTLGDDVSVAMDAFSVELLVLVEPCDQ